MTTIDYKQDSKKILFDMINATNNTQLKAEDFEVSLPEIYVGSKTKRNTFIVISGKASTGYYGSSEIAYDRLNISDVFDRKVFSYNPQTELTLFDLIPTINEFYGIELKEEDLINVDIPAYDPLHPTAPRSIIISAQPASYFFTGSYTLTFGIANIPTVEQDNIARTYYLYIGGYGLQDIKESMISLNFDGSINADFTFLVNAVGIDSYSLNRIERLKNGWFVLNGDFSLTYQNSNQELVPVSNCKSILFDITGFIIDTFAEPYFAGTSNKFYEVTNGNYKYIVDAGNSSVANQVYRFRADTGFLDNTYLASINYVPSMIRVLEDGRIYTVSSPTSMPDPYNNFVPVSQIRIDRLLEDGTLDSTFNPVFIKSSDVRYSVQELYDLLPEATGTVVLYFKPTAGLSNTSPVPVVNGNRIATLNTISQIRYTWNPVIRLNADGSTDSTFNSSLQQFDEGVVMSLPQSVMEKDNKYLVSTSQNLTVFTYRKNPITGYLHMQPLQFERNGAMHLYAGQYYVNQYQWTDLKEIFAQSNGLFLGYGSMRGILNNDTFSIPYSCFVRYSSNSAVDKVLWRSPGPTGTSNPIIERAFMDEVSV